ncbi:MAG: phosphate ABC transporter permease PstA [Clostridiales bacterium]|nr:phosphate ABC transporter permease PstA [Clostridiales bacterium]
MKNRLKFYKKHPVSLLLRIFVYLSAAVTAAVFLICTGYILIKGVPNLKPQLFEYNYSSENVSMLPAVINTFFITAVSLALSVPCGIFSAVFLCKYAKSTNKFVHLVSATAQTLAGIPSIIYGLFGYLVFVINVNLGYSLLSGALTLAIMTLPIIMRTSQEAIKSVPASYREGSFGLGAGKLRTIFKIIIPSALPGIISGVILCVGRIAGETAALIYTAGTAAGTAGALSSGRTLSVHMYTLISEGLYTGEAYACAVVLLIWVAIMNAASETVTRAFSEKRGKS